MSEAGDDTGFRNNLACQTCRQRKRKCDRQLPRCGLCARRGLECTVSVAKNAEGQEGVIEGLEKEVARLESQLSRSLPRDTTSADLRPESPAASSPETVDLNVLREVETVSLYRGELYGLEKMTRRALQLDNSDPRGFLDCKARKNLVASSRRSRQMPEPLEMERSTRYADNFFSHVHPTFPVADEARTRHVLDVMADNRLPLPAPEERITAYLVLAMGAILPSQSSLLDTVNSAKYFLSAAELPFSYDESLKTARILILFTIYSLFDPTAGSSWQLIDLVMQVCIVLGLHQMQVGVGERKDETEGVTIFQAAYILDFFISTALGLPMSIQNSDITCPFNTSKPVHNIFAPSAIFSWAYELCECPNNSAADFLRAYDTHILRQERSTDNLLQKSIPSMLGWHLAIQSLRRLSPDEALVASRKGELIDDRQAAPKTMPVLLMLPWVAGYSAFQAILLQLVICGTAPDMKSRLAQSLGHLNLMLSAVASKFEGLRPHAELGSSMNTGTMQRTGEAMSINFLEGSDLYDFCKDALRCVGVNTCNESP